MRVASLVIGLVGAVVEFFTTLFEGSVGLVGSAVGASHMGALPGLTALSFAASVAALVGAILAMSHPKTAWILLLLSAVAAALGSSAFSIPAVILMLVAALLSFLSSRKTTRSTKHSPKTETTTQ